MKPRRATKGSGDRAARLRRVDLDVGQAASRQLQAERIGRAGKGRERPVVLREDMFDAEQLDRLCGATRDPS